MDQLSNPLARARGLGSAGSGVRHWWMQRLSALLLLPLSLWFVVSLLVMSRREYLELLQWLQAPLTATLLLTLLLALYYHALLGLQVVIEDYMDGPVSKIILLLLVKGVLLLAAVASLLALAGLFLSGRTAG